MIIDILKRTLVVLICQTITSIGFSSMDASYSQLTFDTLKAKRPLSANYKDNNLEKSYKKRRHQKNQQSQNTPSTELSVLDWSVQLSIPTKDKKDVAALKSNLFSLLFKTSSNQFEVEPYSFDSEQAPVAKALATAGSLNDPNAGYILYNDENSQSHVSNGNGHTKGFLFWNSDYIWWTIHSVPKWPTSLEPLSQINPGQRDYCQSLMIIKSPISNLDSFVEQLIVNTAVVYSSKIPETQKAYPWISKLAKRIATWGTYAPKTSVQQISYISSGKSIPMIHFAKSPAWNNDIYDNLISPTLSINTFSETWGRPLMGPTQFSHNVLEVKWPHAIADFSEIEDHSKWAISMDPKQPWVFVMDINRMNSQFRRGGGGIGIQHPILWKAFSELIARSD